MDKFKPFGKNFLNVAIYGTIAGPKQKIASGGAWEAQVKIASDHIPCVAATLGSNKACFHQSHTVPEGVCYKLFANPPPGWSKGDPLILA